MQEILVVVVFLGALVFLGRKFYLMFRKNDASCAQGCASCQAEDIAKIRTKIEEQIQN
ncbi:MAG: FeoB-associated Cys-rich membrane protein [Bacteroidota bacterium]